MEYTHTQKVPENVLAVATVASLALGLTPPGWVLRVIAMGIAGATAFNFRSLTVSLDAEKIRIQYGDGPIKKSFPLAGISSVVPIRTSPIMGWGIHYVGSGWLFNVYGLDAVEITYNNGKKIFIGTDEPHVLTSAINKRIGKDPD